MFCEDDADNMLAVWEWAIIRDPFAPSNFLLLFVSGSKVCCISTILWVYTFTNSLSLHTPQVTCFWHHYVTGFLAEYSQEPQQKHRPPQQ